MLHIVLLILKIIGIILLALLVLMLLLLFYPVKYNGNINVDDKKYSGSIKVGWLFSILSFKYKLSNNDNSFTVRILGIPIIKSDNEKKSKSKKKHKQKAKNKVKESFASTEKTEKESAAKTEKTSKEKANTCEDTANTSKTNKIIEIFRKGKKIIKSSFDNIVKAYNKFKEIKEFIKKESTKEAYRYAKNIIIKILKHIRPRKINANITMGFEEPHVTGQVLGYIAMAYGVLGIDSKNIEITPVFDKKILKGKAKLRGRFCIGILIINILKIYFKKEISDIIKKLSRR